MELINKFLRNGYNIIILTIEVVRLTLERTQISDLPVLEEIYRGAQEFMRMNGNATQWGNNYPKKSLLESDIQSGKSYVLREGDTILATFYLAFGPDPTYAEIEGNGWLNDELYGTLHRVAINQDIERKGLGTLCLQTAEKLALEQDIHNIRIDTHANNLPMQKCIQKNGYTYCGIITVADGSTRLAYQKVI